MLTLEDEYSYSCPGCGSFINEFHRENCDVARCGLTGTQLFSCDYSDQHECENTKWSGYWPGVVECFEYDLFAELTNSWQKTTKYNPRAVPDLNTLMIKGTWNYAEQKWIL